MNTRMLTVFAFAVGLALLVTLGIAAQGTEAQSVAEANPAIVSGPHADGLAEPYRRSAGLGYTSEITLTPAFTVHLPLVSTGIVSHALQFDGADDFVSITDAGDFDFNNAFSVEAWVNPLSLAGSGPYKAIAQGAYSEPPFTGSG